MTPVVSLADTYVVIADTSHEISSAKMTFSIDGVNAAEIQLAVGRSPTGGGVDYDFERGSYSEVVVNGRVMFSGFVDDIVPDVIQSGAVSIKVRIVGKFSWLASGTLQSASVTPKSYLDVDIAPPFGGDGEDGLGTYDLDYKLAATDFALALRESLIRVATDTTLVNVDSITEAIVENFGITTNQLAAAILSQMQGTLTWRDEAVESDMHYGALDVINNALKRDYYLDSFLGKLTKIGELLKFSVYEGVDKLVMFPQLYVASSTNAAIIVPNTYSSTSTALINYIQYSGVVIAASGSQAPQDGVEIDEVMGLFKMPGNTAGINTATGRVHVAPATPVMVSLDGAALFGDDGKAPRVPEPLSNRVIGDSFAKNLCFEMNYERRGYSVYHPYIKTDLGPSTTVQIKLPSIDGVSDAAGGTSIYGMIRSVTIGIDANHQVASTAYEISHCRSNVQQRIIDSVSVAHPFWSDRWAGCDLFGNPRPVVG